MVARETPKLATSSGMVSPEVRSDRYVASLGVAQPGRPAGVPAPRTRAAARAAAARSCISSRS